MTPQTSEGQLLSAELRGEESVWRRLRGAMSSDEWWEVVPVAFVLAARRRFTPDVDRRTATRFAVRFVAQAPSGAVFSARDVEAVLRGVTGEDAILAAVAAETRVRIMYAVLFALADDLELDDAAVDELVVQAEQQIAAAYRAVDVPLAGPADAPSITFDFHRRAGRRYLNDDDVLPSRPGRPRRPRSPLDDKKARKKRREVPRPSTLAGRYLRATLRRDDVERARIGEVSNADLLRIHRSAVGAALASYLYPDPSLPEITALVTLTRDTYYADLDVMKTEHVARAALYEDVPLEGLTSKDVYLASSLMLMIIADWWEQDDAAISSVAVAAEAKVAATGYQLAC